MRTYSNNKLSIRPSASLNVLAGLGGHVAADYVGFDADAECRAGTIRALGHLLRSTSLEAVCHATLIAVRGDAFEVTVAIDHDFDEFAACVLDEDPLKAVRKACAKVQARWTQAQALPIDTNSFSVS